MTVLSSALILAAHCVWAHALTPTKDWLPGGRKLAETNYCGEFGKDDPAYPWATPRSEQDWYCNNIKLFQQERQDAEANNIPLQLVVYGDSIMQCLRWGNEFCETTPEWMQRNWGARYNAVTWALGSETAGTLFWRMLNGNGFQGAGTKAVLLYIGSNDFGQGDQDEAGQLAVADELFSRVQQMCQWMMDQDPSVVVLTLALLPKTGYEEDGSITGRLDAATWAGVTQYNKLLREYGWAEERVRFINCGYPFLEDDGTTIRKDLMKDGLHPNEAGFEKLAKCINPFLWEHIGEGNTTAVEQAALNLAVNSVGRRL